MNRLTKNLSRIQPCCSITSKVSFPLMPLGRQIGQPQRPVEPGRSPAPCRQAPLTAGTLAVFSRYAPGAARMRRVTLPDGWRSRARPGAPPAILPDSRRRHVKLTQLGFHREVGVRGRPAAAAADSAPLPWLRPWRLGLGSAARGRPLVRRSPPAHRCPSPPGRPVV